jgi:hypothetical protein
MGRAPAFVAAVDARLNTYGCTTSREVPLEGGLTAAVAGSRTYFSWKGLVIMSQHLLVQTLDRATVADAQCLFEAGFVHAKKMNWVPLLRGMQFGYMVVPVLAVSEPDAELVRFAEGKPRQRWSLFEFPVLVDLSAGKVHCYRETALWGAFFFSDLRDIVDTCVVPALAES